MWTDSSPRSAPSRSRVREGAFGPDGVVKSAEREPEGGAHVDLVSETGPTLQGSAQHERHATGTATRHLDEPLVG